MVSHVKIMKKNVNVICYSFVENNMHLFAKIYLINDNKKSEDEFRREVCINEYLVKNLKDKRYFTEPSQVLRNVDVPKYLVISPRTKCNIIIFNFCGKHTLRYYINRISQKTFDSLLNQLREATNILKSIGVVHYDLYCQSNIIVCKEQNKLFIKIVDFGLSYIDETDLSDMDYKIALDSIVHFNKKHKINII